MGAEDFAVHFTLARVQPETGDELEEPKSFSLKPGADSRVRIGRGPLCDVVVTSRHASTYHCELSVLRPGGAEPQLCVTDLSMNGTGLTRPGGGTTHLEKSKQTPISGGVTLYVPMTLKANTDPSQRAHFKLNIVGESEASKASKPKHKKHKKKKHKHASAEDDEHDEAQAVDGSEDSQDAAQDNEQKRMVFVELLLKTKEVSAGTSYGEAEKLLSGQREWACVDEATRKECFDIFVEHLGSHGGKQKDKKKKAKAKETDRGKSKKHRRDDDDGDKAERRKRRSRSRDSGERKGRRKHRRGKGSGGSGSPPAKRRRRAANSDSD